MKLERISFSIAQCMVQSKVNTSYYIISSGFRKSIPNNFDACACARWGWGGGGVTPRCKGNFQLILNIEKYSVRMCVDT